MTPDDDDVFKKPADVKDAGRGEKRKKSVKTEVVEEKEEPKPKRMTIHELFAKKTIGEAFDDAQEQYYRRKAMGISGQKRGLG